VSACCCWNGAAAARGDGDPCILLSYVQPQSYYDYYCGFYTDRIYENDKSARLVSLSPALAKQSEWHANLTYSTRRWLMHA
jgi:hypothetical protein